MQHTGVATGATDGQSASSMKPSSAPTLKDSQVMLAPKMGTETMLSGLMTSSGFVHAMQVGKAGQSGVRSMPSGKGGGVPSVQQGVANRTAASQLSSQIKPS